MTVPHTKRKKKTSLFARSAACGSAEFDGEAKDTGIDGVTRSCLMS